MTKSRGWAYCSAEPITQRSRERGGKASGTPQSNPLIEQSTSPSLTSWLVCWWARLTDRGRQWNTDGTFRTPWCILGKPHHASFGTSEGQSSRQQGASSVWLSLLAKAHGIGWASGGRSRGWPIVEAAGLPFSCWVTAPELGSSSSGLVGLVEEGECVWGRRGEEREFMFT